MDRSGDGRCAVCGAPLPAGRRRYCSDGCAREGERIRARSATAGRERPALVREHVCADCGRGYLGHIKSKRCPACQQEANRQHDAAYKRRSRAGLARRIGSEAVCEACGRAYVVEGSRQRWCKDCAPEAAVESRRALAAAWNRRTYSDEDRRGALRNGLRRKPEMRSCAQCGRTFEAMGGVRYCCEACRATGRRAYQREYDAARRQRKKQE